LSHEGAGLRLGDLPLLPCDFKLTFDGFHTVFDCRLIWRDGDFAGITFELTADC
jgi:hypothetical protein